MGNCISQAPWSLTELKSTATAQKTLLALMLWDLLVLAALFGFLSLAVAGECVLTDIMEHHLTLTGVVFYSFNFYFGVPGEH